MSNKVEKVLNMEKMAKRKNYMQNNNENQSYKQAV